MEKRYPHILLTRFNVPVFPDSKWKKLKYSDKDIAPMQRLLDDDYLSRRFKLFESITLPSVSAQVDQNFTWIVMFHSDTSTQWRRKIEQLKRKYAFTDLYFSQEDKFDFEKYCLEKFPGQKLFITSRVDNDDSLAPNYISDIGKYCNQRNYSAPYIITFPIGEKVDILKGTRQRYAFFNNHFTSMCSDSSNNILDINHTHILEQNIEVTALPSSVPMWGEYIHETNCINKPYIIDKPEKNIYRSLKKIDSNVTIKEIALILDSKGRFIRAEVKADGRGPLKCAYYLYKDNEVIKKIKYIGSLICDFEIVSNGVYSVKAFVRDTKGNTVSQRSKDVYVMKTDSNAITNPVSSDVYWYNKYRKSLLESEWTKDVDALQYDNRALLWCQLTELQTILRKIKPASILELGLGESSKLTARYAAYAEARHVIIDGDRHYSKAFLEASPETFADARVNISPLLKARKEAQNYCCFRDFKSIVGSVRFGLIIQHCPRGGGSNTPYADIDMRLHDLLADDFAIVMENASGAAERLLAADILDALQDKGIEACKRYISLPQGELCVIESGAEK